MKGYSNHIKQGYFELYCGTMRSGKTRELINRLDRLQRVEDCGIVIAKPDLDTRNRAVESRFGSLSIDCSFLATPADIYAYLLPSTQVVAFDEMQFFSPDITGVVQELLLKDFYVLGTGLELDFRGEPFGPMPALLSFADEVHKLHAICEVPRCNSIATRPQRLINGAPAPYDSPQILVGDGDFYEPRCIHHHVVPGRPGQR